MGAAIAIAAGMVVVLRPTQEERWTGIKGATSGAAPLRIRYLVAATTPDAALERGADGGRYARDRALVFRVEAGGGGYLYLVRVSRNESERVWPAPGRTDAHVDGGAYDFSEGGRPTAYPLRELKGPQRFAAVLAPEPLDQDRLARLARSLPPEMKAVGGAATEEGITVDAIDLVVE
jgi:hypothetical protein